jgi:chromosome segregation ATPase
MRPTTPFLLSAAALFLATAAAAPARAQQSQPAQTQQPAASGTTASPTQDTTDPLAEAARKARAKEAAQGKPKHVLTNDDLPSSGGVTTEKTTPTDANADDASADQGQDKDKDASDPKSEKYWRKRFADAHTKLAKAEKELDVLQRELNKNQVQYYPDPQKALVQQYTREDINEETAKINAKKAEVESLRQNLSNLEDELRKAGGDPGWAR